MTCWRCVNDSERCLSLVLLGVWLCGLCNAQVGQTDPVGITEMTVVGAPPTPVGATKSSVIGVTLRHPVAYEGTATSIGSFASPSSQDLNTGVTSWTVGQWTNEPHLCYVENAAGAEEAYLITAVNVSTGVLTLSTAFDISTRYPSAPKFTIVKAHTLGNLFGTTAAEVPFKQATASSNADNLYLWRINTWNTYWHNGVSWQSAATAFGGDENDRVVFPDDALFILRRDTPSINLVFTGSVPVKPQISTLPGEASRLTTSRYSEPVRVNQLGFESLTNWLSAPSAANADKFYIWTGSSWKTYWHTGSNWTSNGFTNDDNDLIFGNSGVWVIRDSQATAIESANEHQMPYPGQ